MSQPYPVILPPDHLRGHGKPREWSNEIARAHFDWFMSIRRERVVILLDYFHKTLPNPGEEVRFLLDLGVEVCKALSSEPNYREISTERVLTGPGLSIAHDMGILVAELIVASGGGKVKWVLLKKPPRALEFNMPVLIGQDSKTVLDPIRGSLTEARAILRNKETEIWAKTYEFWFHRFTVGLLAREYIPPSKSSRIN